MGGGSLSRTLYAGMGSLAHDHCGFACSLFFGGNVAQNSFPKKLVAGPEHP